MIGLLIVVVLLTGKVLKLQMNFYVLKFQNMENESDSHNKFAEIDEVLQLLLETAKFIQDEPIEHNPLLDYRNDLIKTLGDEKFEILGSLEYDLISKTNIPELPSSNEFILRKLY